MKQKIIVVLLFLFIYGVYYAFATQFIFRPIWSLDYLNPLAQSFIQLKFDIPHPGSTYDLSYYEGKWYAPWGPLPALFLIPLQVLKGRYVPVVYLSVLFASMTVIFVFLLLQRIKKEFLPHLSRFSIFCFVLLFAFGTTQFYVGTTTSMWFVQQSVTSFFATVGIFMIFKKKRTARDYFLSMLFFSMTLLGRATNVLLISLPLFLYIYDKQHKFVEIKKTMLLFATPLVFFTLLFFAYNYVRFQKITEYGYNYIHESKYLEQIRKTNGIFSFKNVQDNMWYMLLEVPTLKKDPKLHIQFNLNGNSIFFLTPPFLAIFLANPFRRNLGFGINPYITGCWIAILITLIPTVLWYSSGWMQFGYRYTLDVTVMLLLLSLFGMKGKLNILYIAGIVFAIVIYILGITALW